jgi:hypothetical protein
LHAFNSTQEQAVQLKRVGVQNSHKIGQTRRIEPLYIQQYKDATFDMNDDEKNKEEMHLFMTVKLLEP